MHFPHNYIIRTIIPPLQNPPGLRLWKIPIDTFNIQNGCVIYPNDFVNIPKAPVIYPNCFVHIPKASVIYPKGCVKVPKAPVIYPNHSVNIPNGCVIYPNDSVNVRKIVMIEQIAIFNVIYRILNKLLAKGKCIFESDL